MFKAGDKVKYLGGMNNWNRVEQGCTYIIVRINNMGYLYFDHVNHYYDPSYFVLAKKKELKTEVDFLNAFQQNFKE